MRPAWFDAFFILRPTLFFPSWTFFLAGYSRGQAENPGFYLVWIAAALGASFLLNQLSDRREDKLNEKLLPRWGDLISNRMVYIELSVLIIAVIIGGIWAGPELSALLALFFLIAGIFYNFPPLRLKARPVWGIVSCSVGIWIGYLIGARAAGVAYQSACIFGIPYALAGGAVSLLTHIPDLAGDRLSGVKTFPMVYGSRAAAIWAVILVICAALASFFVSDHLLLIASIISLPFFVSFYKRQIVETAELAIKIAIFSLAALVGLTWLPFLLMIVVYYFFARWYHQRRLGMEYPSFRSSSDVA